MIYEPKFFLLNVNMSRNNKDNKNMIDFLLDFRYPYDYDYVKKKKNNSKT